MTDVHVGSIAVMTDVQVVSIDGIFVGTGSFGGIFVWTLVKIGSFALHVTVNTPPGYSEGYASDIHPTSIWHLSDT